MSAKKTAATLLAAFTCLTPAAPAQMHEAPPTFKFPHTGGARSYLQARHEVVTRLGSRAAGRDLVNQGVRYKWTSQDRSRKHWAVRRATWTEVRRATRHLRVLLRPPAVNAPASGWVIPAYVVWCESRDRNLAPNSATASGYYQIIDSTWAAAGGTQYASEAYLAPKWAQDRIAAKIWANQAYYGSWDCK